MRADWWICRYVSIDMVELTLFFYNLIFMFMFTSLSILFRYVPGIFLASGLSIPCEWVISSKEIYEGPASDKSPDKSNVRRGNLLTIKITQIVHILKNYFCIYHWPKIFLYYLQYLLLPTRMAARRIHQIML